jgi:transposase
LTLAYPIAGIDISSTTLDVAVLHADGSFKASSVANSKAAARKLARELARIGVRLAVIEATGGYELIAMAALASEDVPVARVNPRQVRHFAKGIGRLAKTDPIDARVLATFGERARPRVTTLPSAQEARLKALSLRRRQLVDARVAEKNHLGMIVEKDIKAGVQRMIEALDDEIERIEDAIAEQIAACQPMRERRDLLESIPCIAAATSATVIAELPELGQRSTSVLKALVGVAPSMPIREAAKVSATSRADGLACAKLSIWQPKPAIAAILCSSPSMPACAPRANPTSKPSSPASESSSRS